VSIATPDFRLRLGLPSKNPSLDSIPDEFVNGLSSVTGSLAHFFASVFSPGSAPSPNTSITSHGASVWPAFQWNPKRAAMSEVAARMVPILRGEDTLARLQLLVEFEAYRVSSPRLHSYLLEELRRYGYRLRSTD